jgi:hypothetical protein
MIRIFEGTVPKSAIGILKSFCSLASGAFRHGLAQFPGSGIIATPEVLKVQLLRLQLLRNLLGVCRKRPGMRLVM